MPAIDAPQPTGESPAQAAGSISAPAQDRPELSRLRALCATTLESNWTEGERAGKSFSYTRPSPGRYPWQWYWDSCFAAIVWRRLDPPRAERELRTLLSAARQDGFIGHTIFWGGPPRGPRRLFYNVVQTDDPTTHTIQPPMLAWAWGVAVGDPAREPGIVAHHEWIRAQRDLESDGLIWLLQPDESGLDASPQFDPIWRWRAQGLPGFVALVHRNRRLRFDFEAVRAAGGPLVCEVMTNVLHGLSELALGRRSITPALVARLYDERTGLFIPAAWPAVRAPIPLTWSTLSPLALPDLPERIGRRLVEEHLLTERFWTAVAPPSVATDEPSFSPRERYWGLRRYWRGPTWINSVWLVWLGLVRLGYEEPAAKLERAITGVVLRHGPRESYDPHDGTGIGAREFAWSTLALELADPDPGAHDSHIAVRSLAASRQHTDG